MTPKTILTLMAITTLIILSAGCIESINETNLIDKTILLKSNSGYYYGGNGTEIINSTETFKYDISSDIPIDIYIVPSNESLSLYCENKLFKCYPKYTQKQIYTVIDKITFTHRRGILIINNNNKDAKIHIKIDHCII